MEIPILKSSARISSQLNYLCPQLFPARGCWSSQQTNELSLESNELCEVYSEYISTNCPPRFQFFVTLTFSDLNWGFSLPGFFFNTM